MIRRRRRRTMKTAARRMKAAKKTAIASVIVLVRVGPVAVGMGLEVVAQSRNVLRVFAIKKLPNCAKMKSAL